MSILHITNGDSAAGTLRQFIKDPVVITADPLHEGPAPHVDGNEWYELRARHFASGGYEAYEEARRGLVEWDAAIAEADRYDEVVLWFEHDLFDQLLLIRTLDLLTNVQTRVSLICIDRFPGVDRFIGLGQLTAAQLATLVDTRQPLTRRRFAVASRAWDAFRDSEPSKLLDLIHEPDTTHDELPFLAAALTRFLAEYPSTANGLSRSANAVLAALEARPLTGHDLFRSAQALEERPFMGDWTLFSIVHDLADARVPLVSIVPHDRALDLRQHVVALTDAGRDVLAGRHDAVALNGIDCWRGGVHLIGADSSPWRWDARRETLV